MAEHTEQGYLHKLVVDLKQMKREAVKRRRQYEEKGVDPDEVAESVAQGWSVEKSGARSVRVKRLCPVDERLENRFWMLLFKLGYPELSSGRNFSVLIQKKGAPAKQEPIAVFAKDDETVIVAVCRSSEKIIKEKLSKEINHLADHKGDIALSVRRHYGETFKPKIIWLFVTENIIWSSSDRELANANSIRVITERELRYYSQIAEHLGKSARYQFLAEFLQNQEIPELKNKTVPAIRGKLGGHKFYSFVTTPRDLLKISFVNHRSLNDPEGAPTYQRIVSRTRIREISIFIKEGGFFPTNILVNFTRPLRFEKISHAEGSEITFGNLYLPDRYRTAWIIDGQHRLYGFSPLDDRFLDQNIIVVAFEQLSKGEEAQLFVTINHEQRTVPKHLLDDLEGELKWGSEVPSERIGAMASRLITCLNSDVSEPFHNRVTQQGIPSTNKTCLTYGDRD
jgi:DNA sulfur modification protein DndB